MNLLRRIEVQIANGKTTPEASWEARITEQSCSRRRKEYGGLRLDQAKRLKEVMIVRQSRSRDTALPRWEGRYILKRIRRTKNFEILAR